MTSSNDQQSPITQPNGLPVQQETGGTFGWAVLGFLIPVVGLILYLVWKDNKPRAAKSAGKGALVSVIISVVLYVVAFVLAAGSGYY
jgi:hypothetical protein